MPRQLLLSASPAPWTRQIERPFSKMTDREFRDVLTGRVFTSSGDSISVDVGVLERSDRVHVVPGDFGWDDVGTWAALARVREGVPLARALGAGKQFPPMLIHMIASGESWQTVQIPHRLYAAVRKLYPESRPPFRARCFDVRLFSSAITDGSGTTPCTETTSSGEEPQETIGGRLAASSTTTLS